MPHSIPTKEQYLLWLQNTIHQQLERVVAEEFEKEKEEAIKRATEAFERKKGEVIAGIVLHLEERISINDLGREMRIVIAKV